MAKMLLEFDLGDNEDRMRGTRALKSDNLYFACLDFFRQTRQVWKYGTDDEAIRAAEIWEKTLREALECNGVYIDDEMI